MNEEIRKYIESQSPGTILNVRYIAEKLKCNVSLIRFHLGRFEINGIVRKKNSEEWLLNRATILNAELKFIYEQRR